MVVERAVAQSHRHRPTTPLEAIADIRVGPEAVLVSPTGNTSTGTRSITSPSWIKRRAKTPRPLPLICFTSIAFVCVKLIRPSRPSPWNANPAPIRRRRVLSPKDTPKLTQRTGTGTLAGWLDTGFFGRTSREESVQRKMIRGTASMNTEPRSRVRGRSTPVVGDRHTRKCRGNDTSGATLSSGCASRRGRRRISIAGRMRHSSFWKGNRVLRRGPQFHGKFWSWVTLARGGALLQTPGRARPDVDRGDAAGLEDFFRKIGREAVEEEAEPMTRTPRTSRS